MGKGGYLGGSTIIHIKVTKNSLLEGDESFSNKKKYICNICNYEFVGDTYFEHLRKHGLEGCYQCGEPYNPKDTVENNVRICSKCKKRTPVLEKFYQRNEEIYHKTNSNKINNTSKYSSHKKKRADYKFNNKFSLSIGDILQQAFEKKQKSNK